MKRLALCIFWFIILGLNVAAMIWFAVCIMFNPTRATQIALGYDRVGNAAMGQGNETISSWAGRHSSWMERPINWLFKALTGEENHCNHSRE